MRRYRVVPNPVVRTLRLLFALVLLAPAASFASTAPTTPTFVLAWGANGSAPGQLNSPFGVTTDAAGNVYVADLANQRVQKFDGLGSFILQ